MKKTKRKSTPQTLHGLLVKEFGKKSLAYTAQCMLAEKHHSQCTFENNFWEHLRDRGDKRFVRHTDVGRQEDFGGGLVQAAQAINQVNNNAN